MNSYFFTENTNQNTLNTDDTESGISHLDNSQRSKIASMPFRNLGVEENEKKVYFFSMDKSFIPHSSNNKGDDQTLIL